MNRGKEQHKIAVKLLDKLGVQYLRLEQTPAGYRYHGWTVPHIPNNGGAKVRRGVIRLKV